MRVGTRRIAANQVSSWGSRGTLPIRSSPRPPLMVIAEYCMPDRLLWLWVGLLVVINSPSDQKQRQHVAYVLEEVIDKYLSRFPLSKDFLIIKSLHFPSSLFRPFFARRRSVSLLLLFVHSFVSCFYDLLKRCMPSPPLCFLPLWQLPMLGMSLFPPITILC